MIAIKDFGMPHCCVNCDMCLPCALNEGLCHITQKTLSDIYDKRDSDCPLIEIEQSEDCVSRQALLEFVESKYQSNWWNVDEVLAKIKSLPPVAPVCGIATVQFSKEDLREICNERIEIECTHGTCKDCLNHGINKQYEDIDGARYCSSFRTYTGYDFYCADFEKRELIAAE